MTSPALKKRPPNTAKVRVPLKKESPNVKIQDLLNEVNRSVSHIEDQWQELETIQKSILKKLEAVR